METGCDFEPDNVVLTMPKKRAGRKAVQKFVGAVQFKREAEERTGQRASQCKRQCTVERGTKVSHSLLDLWCPDRVQPI